MGMCRDMCVGMRIDTPVTAVGPEAGVVMAYTVMACISMACIVIGQYSHGLYSYGRCRPTDMPAAAVGPECARRPDP